MRTSLLTDNQLLTVTSLVEGASKLSEAFLNMNLKKKTHLFIFRERGKEEKTEGEKLDV